MLPSLPQMTAGFLSTPIAVTLMVSETTDASTDYATSVNATASCDPHADIIKHWFIFDTLHLVRVLITWLLFVLSVTGNSFVLWSLRGDRTRYFIMFHLALSDLIYTVFVMPSDAVWNTTMEWLAGDGGCRICQMMKQFGMYASSFMVVVIGVDRMTGILSPISSENQRKRGLVMVAVAWIASFLCCIPAGIIFSVFAIPTCENIPIYQCVDFQVVDPDYLPPYYFFTMFISFVLPLISTLVSYSLIVCEISNMKARDRALMGRRNTASAASMQRAKKRTILMRTLITFTFILCWGPYYGNGIYDWFTHYQKHQPPGELDTAMYIAMYFNPVLHPLVFGFFMKEIRSNFYASLASIRKSIFKNSKTDYSSRSSFSCAVTGTQLLLSNTTSNNHSNSSPVIQLQSRRFITNTSTSV